MFDKPETHPRLAAIWDRAIVRRRNEVPEGVGHAEDGAFFQRMLREETIAELDHLEAMAVHARTHGQILALSEERLAEVLAEIDDPEDYERVWDDFWAPIFHEHRDDETARYDPNVTRAIAILDQVAPPDTLAGIEDSPGQIAEAIDLLRQSINFDQVKRELADMSMLLDSVPKVYSHATRGMISKPHTTAGAVCDVIDERRGRRDERIIEAAEQLKDVRRLINEAADARKLVPVNAGDLRALLQAIEADL